MHTWNYFNLLFSFPNLGVLLLFLVLKLTGYFKTVISFFMNLICCSFDLYFRKNPFGGEYTVFAGLEECIRLIANFHFKEEDVSFMRSVMPNCEVQHAS